MSPAINAQMFDLSSQPIFIVGMQRSGTTLLRSVLSAHPRITIAPELDFFRWTKKYSHLNLNRHKEFELFWQDLIEDKRFLHLDIDAEKIKNTITAKSNISLQIVFAELLTEYALKMQKKRWGEKTPGNEKYIDELMKWFPMAKVLFIIRDPRAVYASLMKTPWCKNKYADLHARTWKESVSLYDKWKDNNSIYVLKYESFVSNPVGESKLLCQFLGEKYDNSMINRREKSIPLGVDNNWRKQALKTAMKPIQQQSLKKWQTCLSNYQISLIEEIAGCEMISWGYELAGKPLGFANTIRWQYDRTIRSLIQPLNLAKQMVRRIMRYWNLQRLSI